MKLYITDNGAIAHQCIGDKDYYHSAYRIKSNKIICYLDNCDVEVPSLFYFYKTGKCGYHGFWLGAKFHTLNIENMKSAKILENYETLYS